MVKFDLAGAHPRYRDEVPEILTSLARRYPGAGLRTVRLYRPEPGDLSMAATLPGGVIQLNEFWFVAAPDELSEAARCYPVVVVDGVTMGWHGPMTDEPEHVLTHEFGHVAMEALRREAADWARERWQRATHDPVAAPSGYALANPEEFFGEEFALVHLCLATEDETADLLNLIDPLRRRRD